MGGLDGHAKKSGISALTLPNLAGSVQEIANHRFAAKVDHERKALIDVPDGEGGIRFSFEEVSPPSSKAG